MKLWGNLRAAGLVCVILIACSLSSTTARGDWIPSATVSASPGTVYIGIQTTFSYELYNGKSSSVDITDIHVKFDWQTTTVYDLLDTRVAIAPYDTYSFDLTITVPDVATGTHSQEIYIKGQAVGDWFESSATWTDAFEVKVVPPLLVSVLANPSTGTEPLAVQFTSVVSGGLPPYSYSWTFGDGGTSAVANPSHTYTSAGTFTANLIVSDSATNVKTDSVTVTVSEAPFFGGEVLGGNSGAIVLVILVVVISVVILVLALILVRKKRA